MQQTHNIIAIVVTYNPDIPLLDREYESLVNQVTCIVYIDNGSKNKREIEEWSRNKQRIQLLFNTENKGLGISQNEGITKAIELGATHVAIFDQDSVVDSGFIKGLLETEVECKKKGINVGVVGPVYRTLDGIYYPVVSIENNKVRQYRVSDIDSYLKVSHNISSGQLIQVAVLKEVGLMRGDYFIEYIDFEWCLRLQRYDYVVIVTKKCSMQHVIGDKQLKIFGRMVGIYSPFRRYFTCRNAILFYKEKHVPKVFARRQLFLSMGKFVISILYGPLRIKQFKYCIRGYIDGLKGVTGPCSI